MKYYAGIGSRETPRIILEVMEILGANLADKGWTLRSGHAQGADIAFERGAASVHGRSEIFIPWKGFSSENWTGLPLICPPFNAEAEEIASRFHPNWKACSPAARKLHTRNVYQVAGLDLNTPVEMVICWTRNASGQGGTGLAIRIAKSLDIPVFDLADESCWDSLESFVNDI